MAARIVGDGVGHSSWEMVRDEKFHREYNVVYRVEVDSLLEGPAVALTAPNLPFPGAQYLLDNDQDLWAWCHPNLQVRQAFPQDKYFDLSYLFSTRPLDICSDDYIENPLLMMQKVSGGTIRYTEEAVYDKFSLEIRNSAWENVRGSQVEFDKSRPTVRIEQNVPQLQFEMVNAMMNTLNDATLWGMPARKIKLSNWTWERKFHANCMKYYTRIFEFEIHPEGFDRTVIDEGTKVLNGHWSPTTGAWILDKIPRDVSGITVYDDPSAADPSHFIRYHDRQGNPSRVILNGAGLPAGVILGTGTSTVSTGPPGNIFIAHYQESNFLLLQIVTEF